MKKYRHRTKLIAFRVTIDEYQYLRGEADERDMDQSKFYRKVLLSGYFPTERNSLTKV